MKNLKKLSRSNVKKVTGGYEQPDGNYVCCWDNNPTICSTSVSHDHDTQGNLSCVKGAHLVKVG
ncbi:hypothetical protein EIH07_10685 [Chryseobacterium taklimakanense]|uniref:bacteriocin-like protein n=1 Tax=Chryseobacterium taklimakanense TaxID=536441 RepID=UPI000F6028BF|nr:hypothetical protein [Chryseobacterium taklimakanense]AZI23468.1 hypothetical protein EIH07_10685 [Chryseobacterium taklimakanense]